MCSAETNIWCMWHCIQSDCFSTLSLFRFPPSSISLIQSAALLAWPSSVPAIMTCNHILLIRPAFCFVFVCSSFRPVFSSLPPSLKIWHSIRHLSSRNTCSTMLLESLRANTSQGEWVLGCVFKSHTFTICWDESAPYKNRILKQVLGACVCVAHS